MPNSFFSVLTPARQPVGNGTALDLIRWLEDYVNALFPDNSIEYWSDNKWSDHPLDLKPESLVLAAGADSLNYTAAACWATQGHSEGRLIQVYLIRRDRALYRLAWVKTFDSLEQSWRIARAIHLALEEYLAFSEVPEIVNIFRSLPSYKRNRFEVEQDALEFLLCASLHEIKITSPSGEPYFIKPLEGEARKLLAQAYLEDCRRVLRNLPVRYQEQLSAELT